MASPRRFFDFPCCCRHDWRLLFFGLSWIDSLGGLMVSILIIQAGYKNGYTAALELADSCRTVPLDIIDANTQAVQTALTRAGSQKH